MSRNPGRGGSNEDFEAYWKVLRSGLVCSYSRSPSGRFEGRCCMIAQDATILSDAQSVVDGFGSCGSELEHSVEYVD